MKTKLISSKALISTIMTISRAESKTASSADLNNYKKLI